MNRKWLGAFSVVTATRSARFHYCSESYTVSFDVNWVESRKAEIIRQFLSIDARRLERNESFVAKATDLLKEAR